MRPVALGNAPQPAGHDPFARWVLAALKEIEQASNQSLINDTSSSGNALATVTGAAADQFAYFTDATHTAFASLNALGRSLLASSSSGSFTLAAAATTTVTNTAVTATSIVLWMPSNAPAATLLGSANALYLSARSAGASFTVATASAAAAAGTETFSYLLVNP